jgi:hypothetical protein
MGLLGGFGINLIRNQIGLGSDWFGMIGSESEVWNQISSESGSFEIRLVGEDQRKLIDSLEC